MKICAIIYVHMPPAIIVTVRFDANLQKLTGAAQYPVTISEAASFTFLLMSIMTEHPEIARMYPPGTLRLTLNGKRPETYSPLFHGDVIHITT